MIAIIDYGMGNLRSVSKAFESQGAQVQVTDSPDQITKAQKLVVPGVGHFGSAITNLTKRGLGESIRSHIQSGKPYLGICLGYQILFQVSSEDTTIPGLGILPGKVSDFKRGGNWS